MILKVLAILFVTALLTNARPMRVVEGRLSKPEPRPKTAGKKLPSTFEHGLPKWEDTLSLLGENGASFLPSSKLPLRVDGRSTTASLPWSIDENTLHHQQVSQGKRKEEHSDAGDRVESSSVQAASSELKKMSSTKQGRGRPRHPDSDNPIRQRRRIQQRNRYARSIGATEEILPPTQRTISEENMERHRRFAIEVLNGKIEAERERYLDSLKSGNEMKVEETVKYNREMKRLKQKKKREEVRLQKVAMREELGLPEPVRGRRLNVNVTPKQLTKRVKNQRWYKIRKSRLEEGSTSESHNRVSRIKLGMGDWEMGRLQRLSPKAFPTTTSVQDREQLVWTGIRRKRRGERVKRVSFDRIKDILDLQPLPSPSLSSTSAATRGRKGRPRSEPSDDIYVEWNRAKDRNRRAKKLGHPLEPLPPRPKRRRYLRSVSDLDHESD